MSLNHTQERSAPPIKTSALRNPTRVAQVKDLQAALKEGDDPLDGRQWDAKALMDRLDQPATNRELLLLADAVDDSLAGIISKETLGGLAKGVFNAVMTKSGETLDALEVNIIGKVMTAFNKRLAESVSFELKEMLTREFGPLVQDIKSTVAREFDVKMSELSALKTELAKYVDRLEDAKNLIENITVFVPPESNAVDVEVKQLPSVVNIEVPQQPQRLVKGADL